MVDRIFHNQLTNGAVHYSRMYQSYEKPRSTLVFSYSIILFSVSGMHTLEAEIRSRVRSCVLPP